MQDRAMMLGKIALARGTLALSLGAAVRMAIGAQIAQPQLPDLSSRSKSGKGESGEHNTNYV
jgi:hypothetical protein